MLFVWKTFLLKQINPLIKWSQKSFGPIHSWQSKAQKFLCPRVFFDRTIVFWQNGRNERKRRLRGCSMPCMNKNSWKRNMQQYSITKLGKIYVRGNFVTKYNWSNVLTFWTCTCATVADQCINLYAWHTKEWQIQFNNLSWKKE